MTTQKSLPKTWNLDVIFQGGSRSEELAAFFAQLDADIQQFEAKVGAAQAPQSEAELRAWAELIGQAGDLNGRLEEVSEFSICISSWDTSDEGAPLVAGRVAALGARLKAAMIRFDALLAQTGDTMWERLVAQEGVREVEFALQERRRKVQVMLPTEQETLISALAVDGYEAWERFFEKVIGRVRMNIELDGKVEEHSMSTIYGLYQKPDADIRRSAYQQAVEALKGEAELCAAALNSIIGFRLQTYKARGWESPLQESLLQNGMSEATLNSMWSAVEQGLPRVARYLERRKRLQGVDELHFVDIYAPAVAKSSKQVTWEECAEIILEQFGTVSGQMQDLARRAFEEGWMDCQKSPQKAPVGFCASFPVTGESRILGTFSGNLSSVSTLIAHELGHAFHYSMLKDLPRFAQLYSKSTAETASTFAERLVMDALLQKVEDREERIALLASKLDNAVLYCMFTYQAYLFDRSLYAERAHGLVSAERMAELMLQAQQTAYHGAMDECSPWMWIWHGHYYDTVTPFYNYPYAFGSLFSAGIYAMAQREGAAFEAKYIALLRDTGRMSVEELAHKHLGVDLTQQAFWLDAVAIMTGDLEEFLELTK
ncbi:pepF/M3 family oligoendopeptidase [Tumebacillus sp. BK434]|uniref:M3 family oligoendopeptidase n=1 Tax=Tumebacillus sp. BK434 TaxID=2512169 RepID=UPI00104C2B11|nr:M3 family oligoendopeptidase [Tumebacillus sp. BK434]TCP55740.1 pepF/M3 family oligoendopeptidase [Tumebacillus sp. BK434]